ncbi:sigma-70 family RNA polymerase sigma factor [Paenibacillus sp. FSL R10-2782]|uniref:sigma-70 family RNA polymerase sigma factor n=1 Tax=Paenibacillus sp. FSL R10-2782 TaxID=2954661 RepID=UPI00315987BA
MSHDSKTGIHVEKGFSRYVHACLYHASRDFFRKADRDFYYTVPLNENTDLYLTINIFPSSTIYEETQEELYHAVQQLSLTEKKLLFLKYIEKRTDSEIGKKLGVTQQAVNKAKHMILDKLKSKLEL